MMHLVNKHATCHVPTMLKSDRSVFDINEGLDGGGGVWYSLFIKNLARYSSNENCGLFIKIRPIIH